MMEIALKQNDGRLNPDIQEIGCFFRSALRMAEYASDGKTLTADEINGLWKTSKRKGFIDGNNDVVNSAAIANEALKILETPGKFTEVATFTGGTMGWYKSVPKDRRSAEYFIQKIKQNGPNKIHFRNVDKFGNLIWDPHVPVIVCRGIIYTICYRYEA